MTIGARAYSLFAGVRIAIEAITANKVRAGLTILGIAVGVFVVTVMSAAVHGINDGVSKSMAAAGPTTFFVTRWPPEINSCNGSSDSCPWRRNPPLTLAQATDLARLPEIRSVVAHVSSSTQVKYAERELPGVSLDAYTPGWMDVNGGDIVDGARLHRRRERRGDERGADQPEGRGQAVCRRRVRSARKSASAATCSR